MRSLAGALQGARPLAWLTIALVLAPWAWLKLVLLAAGCCAVFSILSLGQRVARPVVAVAAAAALWIAHVASPYWMLAPGWPWRIAALLAVSGSVILWAWLAATELRWRPTPPPLWPALLVVSVLAILNLPALGAPIEFRGDEDVHLARPLALLEGLQALAGPHGLPACVLLVLLLFGLALLPRFRNAAGALGLIGAPLALVVLFAVRPPTQALLVKLGRYPLASAWLHSLAAFSPLHLLPALQGGIYREALYRLVPAGAAFVLALWLLRVLKGSDLNRALGALVLVTLPVVTYYTNALYPELPAFVLLAIGLYGLDAAAVRCISGRGESSGCLLAFAAGLLLKESASPIGVAAVAYYGLWALRAGQPMRSMLARLCGWLRLATITLGPLGLYLAWRQAVPSVRSSRDVVFDWSALGATDLYTILPRALGQQFGPALLLAAIGLWVSARRQPRRAGLFVLVGLATLIFQAVESVGRPYWGYSRYLFVLFAPVCCLAVEGCRAIASRHAATFTLTAAALLGWQLTTRPVGWDGSRPPYWGDYLIETSGERYPYDALYHWLKQTGARGELRIVGRDYAYRDDFYLKKYDLALSLSAPLAPGTRSADLRGPGTGQEALVLRAELNREAASAPTGAVLVAHVSARDDPEALPRSIAGFRVVRTFLLGTRALVVYSDAGEAAPR